MSWLSSLNCGGIDFPTEMNRPNINFIFGKFLCFMFLLMLSFSQEYESIYINDAHGAPYGLYGGGYTMEGEGVDTMC